MNKFSLIFSDSLLEERYQESQRPQILHGFKINTIIPIISYAFQAGYWMIKNQIVLSIVYIILTILYTFFFYKVVIRQQWYKIVSTIVLSFSLQASIMQFIPFWIQNLADSEINWIEDTAIQMGLHMNITQNLIQNAILYAIFISTRIYFRSIFEFNPMFILFLLFTILTCYNEYQRIKGLRYQFLWKEKNLNQYFIFDDLIKESLVILNYNDVWDKFKVIYANKSFYSEYHDNPIDFLKETQLSLQKMSTMTYLHYKIQDFKSSFQINAFWKSKNQHLFIECWKYSIMDTQIILKITTKKAYTENNMYPLLYKGILKKLKKIDRQHYHTESLKNLLAALLVKPKSIVNFKIQSLNYNKLSALLMNILRDNAALFSLNLKSDAFYTNIPLLYILMISVSKYYKVSTFSVRQLNESILEIIVKGPIKKNTEQNQQFFKKLMSIIVDMIGIEQIKIENNQFMCKIMNMENPFISTMN
ncbi:unnamed protein product [Paramecium primaurelia]|uniref:Transmembrane protein n=1 Tax=Paramecium primaurelia TaxID=5886 RepID=A0A8S1MSJ9_PARPR|nr:unnamed protein product [Paramecium primaurelia]